MKGIGRRYFLAASCRGLRCLWRPPKLYLTRQYCQQRRLGSFLATKELVHKLNLGMRSAISPFLDRQWLAQLCRNSRVLQVLTRTTKISCAGSREKGSPKRFPKRFSNGKRVGGSASAFRLRGRSAVRSLVSGHASCRVVSRRVASCRVVSCRVVSCRVVSCRVIRFYQ